MVDQNNTKGSDPDQTPSRSSRGGRRGTFLIALLAVALLAGFGGSMLSSAFGQPFGWHHGGWRGGMFGGPLTPAQIDDRIDRMTKHMAIELDATADQQAKIAGIAKAAVGDLLPLRERARATRTQALALLTAPTIDRSCNRAAARRADRPCRNREQAHRAGAGRCRRSVEPRAAQDGRRLDDVRRTVGALASRLAHVPGKSLPRTDPGGNRFSEKGHAPSKETD